MIERGACAGRPPDWWELDAPQAHKELAVRICHTCPIRPDCYTMHYADPKNVGNIRGGYAFPAKPTKKHPRGGPVDSVDYDRLTP